MLYEVITPAGRGREKGERGFGRTENGTQRRPVTAFMEGCRRIRRSFQRYDGRFTGKRAITEFIGLEGIEFRGNRPRKRVILENKELGRAINEKIIGIHGLVNAIIAEYRYPVKAYVYEKEKDVKKMLLSLCLAILAGISAFAADPVVGLWKSVDEQGKTTAAWRIYESKGLLFGEIVTVPNQREDILAESCKPSYKDFPVAGDVRKMKVLGTPFIFNLRQKAAGQWADGSIIDPKDGKLYKCKITFHPADGKKYPVDTLEMRGEIGMGIGRSQEWVATDDAEIDALRKLPKTK